MHADVAHANKALKTGGLAFVLKSSGGDELLTAIHEVLNGRKFVTPAIAAQTSDAGETGGARRTKGLEWLAKSVAGGAEDGGRGQDSEQAEGALLSRSSEIPQGPPDLGTTG